MRKLVLALMLGAMLTTSSGCIIPAYSGDRTRRTQELLITSENLRMIQDTWQRVWFLDMPSHLSPFRTHGGLI